MADGLFLGRRVDPKTGKTTAEPVYLDPKDLTTHGLVVGMTGSGKTALGIVLIEELLLRGIPVLAVDPKGDLANLLLAFPSLSAAEFEPWVDHGTGATGDGEAKKWSEGLAGWGLSAADVARLGACRTATVYTPGSTAGVPLDLLGSVPPPRADADPEDRRDVVTAFVGGVLGLVGVDADPVKSRESILLCRCVEAIWERGETATLEGLVMATANPPFATMGALPLETFYPSRERQELVLALNGLLASPTSAAFRTGAPLDVGSMLSPGANGRTRLSIVSIAHLSDAERVFVVATLLTRVKAWMRSQPGTSALRALVYVDEIFGFFPPSAEPATKKPLLTLLKQARAFGLGVVVATQNPVDLDYKGLANCGCWWVGTLQTERDRKRLEDGLTEAVGSSDPASLLDGTRKRVFLLHDVHRGSPGLVETRWAMSYLRGPMTREELSRLKGEASPREPLAPSAPLAGASIAAVAAAVPPVSAGTTPPALPSGWSASWLDKRGAEIARAHLCVRFAVRYRLQKAVAPEVSGVKLFRLEAASAGEVLEGEPLDVDAEDLASEAPARRLRYDDLPSWLGPQGTKALERSVKERLPDRLATKLWRDPVSGVLGVPGESAEAFAARAGESTRPSAAVLQKLERKRLELARAEAEEKGREMESYASMASAAMDVIGGFLGKKKTLRVGKVGSVLSKRRQEGAAESRVGMLRAEIEALEAQAAPPDAARFEEVEVVPARAHVDVLAVGIAWVS